MCLHVLVSGASIFQSTDIDGHLVSDTTADRLSRMRQELIELRCCWQFNQGLWLNSPLSSRKWDFRHISAANISGRRGDTPIRHFICAAVSKRSTDY